MPDDGTQTTLTDSVTSGAVQPVIILVHGATLNGHMWNPVRRFLNPNYRVVTPDLPGHGVHLGERFTLKGGIEAVVAAAKSVAPAAVILVGDSLGAYTSMAAASSLPREQLKGLVLGGATFNFVGKDVLSYYLRGRAFRVLAALFGEQRVIRKLMPKALGRDEFNLSVEDAREIIDSGMSIIVFGQAVQALRGVDFRAKLAAIEQPVLIINGDKDTLNVRHEASFLAVAKLPTSHRFDCEHGVSMWRPQKFAELVNEFAERVFR
jgi:pimeloyl-ACP methyl ester carboxylesterase